MGMTNQGRRVGGERGLNNNKRSVDGKRVALRGKHCACARRHARLPVPRWEAARMREAAISPPQGRENKQVGKVPRSGRYLPPVPFFPPYWRARPTWQRRLTSVKSDGSVSAPASKATRNGNCARVLPACGGEGCLGDKSSLRRLRTRSRAGEGAGTRFC